MSKVVMRFEALLILAKRSYFVKEKDGRSSPIIKISRFKKSGYSHECTDSFQLSQYKNCPRMGHICFLNMSQRECTTKTVCATRTNIARSQEQVGRIGFRRYCHHVTLI
jgi:hypothetical protein